MAKRSLAMRTFTPTAFADSIALTDNVYCGFIQGGAALQRVHISEIYMGGQAAASAAMIMLGGMNSVLAGTPSVGTVAEDGPLDGATAALGTPVDAGCTAAIAPQRSPTVGQILSLSFNAFGGVVRWLAPPGGEIAITGAVASTGSFSLSAFTGSGSGAIGSHIIYESM